MKNIVSLIGNTPMYHIENTNIYVKLEKYNASGSIKDRAVLSMIQEGIKVGDIRSDSVLIEASSGNTGISMAMLGSAFRIPLKIIMPENMTEERRRIILAYGAELILTDGRSGMQGAVQKMQELLQENPNYVNLNQFENPANVYAHFNSTGSEILKQVPNVDIFVCCAGTGGTFSGVSQRLKDHDPNIHCVIGEPENSALLSGHDAGSHKIQGIGANFIPKNIKKEYIDDIMMVKDDEAFAEMMDFSRKTGILIGISSGANLALAKRLSKYYPQHTIVTIAPDGGEKYLSILDL